MNKYHIWINRQNIWDNYTIRQTWLFKAPPTGGVACWIEGWLAAAANKGCCCWYCKLDHCPALFRIDAVINPEDVTEASLGGNVEKLLANVPPTAVADDRVDPVTGPAEKRGVTE